MSKELEFLEAIGLMSEDDELNCHFYPLTDHVGVYVMGIEYKDNKWRLTAWNDYQDCYEMEKNLEEKEALEYISYHHFSNNILTPPTAEEIVKKLNEHIKGITQYWQYQDSTFFNPNSQHTIRMGINGIRIYGIDDLPLKLAHDITTFFINKEEKRNERD